MNNLKDTLKKYVHMTPQTFSYTMIGLSTAVLVFFIAYKDDDTPNSDDKPSKSDDKPSKSDDKPSKSDDKPSKSDDELPEEVEEDEEQFDFDKNEEPMRMGDSRVGDSRVGGSRSSRVLDKSKHGKNTKTRKKGNKKHK
jgi:hypothetical protein